jgi:hypothetical protein
MKILKLAAVVFSIALFGLYVAYRSGGQTTTFSGSKSASGVIRTHPTSTPSTAAATATTAPTTAAITREQFLIYSSKSAPVFKPPQAIGGSKSFQVFPPGDQPVLYDDNGPTALLAAPATTPATRQATTGAAAPATTQSSVIPGAGFKLSNTIGAEFAGAADMCSPPPPPATQPAGAR